MKEFLKRCIPTELKKEDKSEAQKETEIRSDKYTEFFKKPLDYFQSHDKPKLGMAYKAVAGFFINSVKLDSTRPKYSFWEKLEIKKGIRRKALFMCETGIKIVAKTILSSVQFIVRNSIKQPTMLLFRLGASANNLRKYRKAKISGDNTRTTAELKNLKYQAQETRNAIIGTALTAAIIISTLGSAGITASFFGAATTVIVTTASAIDTAALAKDTVEGVHKQTKGRKQLLGPSKELEIELSPIQETLAKNSSPTTPYNSSLPYNHIPENLDKHR